MAPAGTTVQPANEGQLLRAVAASAIGTTIEWYDFFLYGVAAASVFPKKFFPGSDPFVATLLSFSTYFVGFAARPIGAAIFGHYGDRVGRKSLLITTMMMMGIATVGIGLVPSYATIGIWGAVLLTLGRVLQGLGVGGAWSGSVLMAGEWADPRRRGFTTSFAQLGAPAGMVLANGALALMTAVTSDQAFLDWGWRIPFLASIILVFVGLYIRIGVLETPVFANLKAKGTVARAPVIEVLRRNWRQVILTALLRTGQQVPFYIFTTYVITYGTQQLGFSRGTILNYVMIQSLLSIGTVVLFGYLSDIFGRRKVTAFGCAVMLVFPFLYFGMLDTKSAGLVFLAIVIAMPIQDIQYGPQAAFISEAFPGSLRYSGSALGYQLASITAGGPAPLLALYLMQHFHSSTPIAIYISISALISLVCVFILSEGAGHLDHQ
ncbi:MAG TPA: MFS transporter [Vicinamibacterales bacterium]|jgi:metabolite-proton symporter|nr:MFS transporter [Vicinamibacterales bacterium]